MVMDTRNPNGRMKAYTASQFEASFRARCSPQTDGCVLWTGATYVRGGYGKVWYQGREQKAHRVAWMLANGPWPTDKPVGMHLCDRPLCVNPEHIRPGTQAENMAGCSERGRDRGARGEAHYRAKLTTAMVVEIREQRAAGLSTRRIAATYGVGSDQISRICTGKVWPEAGGPRTFGRANTPRSNPGIAG